MASKASASTNISLDEFQQTLGQYGTLIESISSEKGSKPGQETLLGLDQFRYEEATAKYSLKHQGNVMNHDDVKKLVDWKLRHGKFRPTLMKLVSSNDPQTVHDTLQKAVERYQSDKDVQAALDGISALKGIGPATASLLLSIHDPSRVIFFSDEAFYWLCCGGKPAPIKYNAKECRALQEAAEVLIQRLDVSATDIEKVAYVLMKWGSPSAAKSGSSGQNKRSENQDSAVKGDKQVKKRQGPVVSVETDQTSLRRSKRIKTS